MFSRRKGNYNSFSFVFVFYRVARFDRMYLDGQKCIYCTFKYPKTETYFFVCFCFVNVYINRCKI